MEEEKYKLTKQQSEEGELDQLLKFAWSDSGNGYVVMGILDNDLTKLVIPNQYQGKAVVKCSPFGGQFELNVN